MGAHVMMQICPISLTCDTASHPLRSNTPYNTMHCTLNADMILQTCAALTRVRRVGYDRAYICNLSSFECAFISRHCTSNMPNIQYSFT